MADRIPTYLVGTSPTFTAIGLPQSGDRMAGLVNESDLVNNSIIYKNSAGEVTPLVLTQDTLVGNVGSGVAAVSAAELLALVFDQFNGTKGMGLVHNGTTWVTLDPGTNGQLLAANSSTATGLEYVDAPTSGVDTLDGLTDVSAAGSVDKEFLKYNGASWVNSRVEIDDLDWIDITGINAGEGLAWSGTRFEPVVLGAGSADDLGDHTATQDLQMGTFNVDLTTGGVVFNNELNISGANWTITDPSGVLTLTGGGSARFTIDSATGAISAGTAYANTRDDSGSTTPENFLYTDASGNVLSADLDSADFATWADIQLSDLTDVLPSGSITDGYVLTWNNTESRWEAQASTAAQSTYVRIGSAQTLVAGQGYIVVEGPYELELPTTSGLTGGEQIRIVLNTGDWQNTQVTMVTNTSDALTTLFDGQATPFLANGSTLYLTYDATDDNWIGSV